MRKLLEKIDLNDVNTFLGLSMLGSGLWMISVPLALCVIGGLLFALGVVGALRKGAG
jgi:hypothetical protein